MSALLAEERRMERQLYRQSVCSESDSNQESRDSGVELDHKHQDVWSHSRNDSEVNILLQLSSRIIFKIWNAFNSINKIKEFIKALN